MFGDDSSEVGREPQLFVKKDISGPTRPHKEQAFNLHAMTAPGKLFILPQSVRVNNCRRSLLTDSGSL